MDSRIQIGKHNFQREALQPFGEQWTHNEKDAIEIDALLRANIHEITEQVRERSLIVIQGTHLIERWSPVPYGEEASVDIPHMDRTEAGNVLVHVLHGKGPRKSTAYAKNAALTYAAKQELPYLRTFIENTPKWIIEKFNLKDLLEYYEHEEACYMDPSFISCLRRIEKEIEYSGRSVLRFVTPPNKNTLELITAAKGLFAFYTRIQKRAEQYLHPWGKEESTVLSWHDNESSYSEEKRERHVYHSRRSDLEINEPEENILQRNFILGESEGGSRILSLPRNRRFRY